MADINDVFADNRAAVLGPGLPAGAPESRAAGFVSARNNEPEALTHRVRNVGTTLFDVIDVQILKRPGGPAAPPISAPIKAGDVHWVEAAVTHTFVHDGRESGVLAEFELK